MSARLSTAQPRRGPDGDTDDSTGRSRVAWALRRIHFRWPTVVELLGVVGVGVGFWLLAGVAGVVVALAVVLLWYGFSGVYGFAAGQFLLAAALPARIGPDLVTPELVGLQAALVLVLVGDDHRGGRARWRRLVRTLAVGAVLTGVALAVGVGSAAVADETLLVVAIGGTFVVLTVGLSAVGRLLVSPVVDEPTAVGDDGDNADGAGAESTG